MFVDSWYFHYINGKTSGNATPQQPTLFAAVSPCFADALLTNTHTVLAMGTMPLVWSN